MRLPYRLLPHTGDIRVKVRGRSLRQLFQNSVFMLTDQFCDARKVKALMTRKVSVRGENSEDLLVRLLQEVLFLFDAKRFVIRSLKDVKLEEGRLSGMLYGEKFSPGCHGFKTEIKAVTYHRLKIGRVRGGWEAEIVLDV